MIKKVRETIEKYHLLSPGDRVIVGLSGGPDSVALLQVLALLSQEYGIALIAAHLDHGLRGGESDEERRFACSFSNSLGVPCACKTVGIRQLSRDLGKSIEEVGRDQRYEFLLETARTHRANKIALGHHLHDHVETVLMNLIRGCGVEGLRGILPLRDGIIIRPLISVTRTEIMEFLAVRRLTYMDDRSNRDTAFRRNRIRNKLLPVLKAEYNPSIETTVARLSEIAVQDDDYLHNVVLQVLSQLGVREEEETVRFEIPLLLQHHQALQRRVIKLLLERQAGPGTMIGYAHVQAALDLMRCGRPSGTIDLPGSIDIKREYAQFAITKKDSTADAAEQGDREESPGFCYQVTIPGRVDIGEICRSVIFDLVEGIPSRAEYGGGNVIFMDYDKLMFPLMIRSRLPGDRIRPLGLGGSKKIKDCFIERRIPRSQRGAYPLLADGESVLWIPGADMSERIKITAETLKVVKAEIV